MNNLFPISQFLDHLPGGKNWYGWEERPAPTALRDAAKNMISALDDLRMFDEHLKRKLTKPLRDLAEEFKKELRKVRDEASDSLRSAEVPPWAVPLIALVMFLIWLAIVVLTRIPIPPPVIP